MMDSLILLQNIAWDRIRLYARQKTKSVNSAPIRQLNFQIIMQLDQALLIFQEVYPSVYATRAVSKPMLSEKKLSYKLQLIRAKSRLAEADIEPELIKVLFTGLRQYIQKERLTHGELFLVETLLIDLQRKTPESSKALISELIARDINLPQLWVYLTEQWQAALLQIEDMHGQLSYLAELRDWLTTCSGKGGKDW